MEYKLFAVRVFVTDWKRAIRFYSETLGMTIAYQSDEMGGRRWPPTKGSSPSSGSIRPMRKVQQERASSRRNLSARRSPPTR